MNRFLPRRFFYRASEEVCTESDGFDTRGKPPHQGWGGPFRPVRQRLRGKTTQSE
ncbi:hypothetical protein ZHAS_00019444 [Anopheles sinensis]|uniref:Uncharacterized protein n=1 Tax=Anopheles sinensis TaxID=74873 RepID=A0A084WLT9_ANOSI|nr:hypothetical protein ZHAS_00019444 [Anopheles sinensis]